MERIITMWAAAFGFLGVGLGAFGAHALRTRISDKMLAVYQTGIQYHLVHALALLAVAALCARNAPTWGAAAAGCFAGGIVLFSGSLYLLACTPWRWMGMVTPLGGILWLVGWGLLFWGAWQKSL